MVVDLSKVEWVRSLRSVANGACVEIALLPDGGAAVRDSKDPTGAVLVFTRPEWDAFVGGVHDGEFDRS